MDIFFESMDEAIEGSGVFILLTALLSPVFARGREITARETV